MVLRFKLPINFVNSIEATLAYFIKLTAEA